MARRGRLFCLQRRVGAVRLLATVASAQAQAWPTRPLRIIVGFPPAVSPTPYREAAQPLTDALKQPIVIENKPGGAGLIAMDAIAKGDDHTVGS